MGSISNLIKSEINEIGSDLIVVRPSSTKDNMTNVIEVDGTNVFDLTKAELQARKQIPEIINFLRENVKGYSNCVALSSSSYVGVRETRRLKGRVITSPPMMDRKVAKVMQVKFLVQRVCLCSISFVLLQASALPAVHNCNHK